MRPIVYFRADGNQTIGLGHLFRCLSLAQMLQPVFDTVFLLSHRTPTTLFHRINFAMARCEVIPVGRQEIQWLTVNVPPVSLLVVDSYELDANYFRELQEAGIRIVYIDDQGQTDVPCYGLINHLVAADEIPYSRSISHLFLGPAFAILRKEFLDQSIKQNNRSFDGSRIFVCLGGADPNQVTLRVLHALMPMRPAAADVLVGAAFVGTAGIEVLARHLPWIKLHRELSAGEIIELASSTSIAILTPGMISYELFALGVPTLCGYISDTQQRVVQQFENLGLVVSVGDFCGPALERGFVQLTPAKAILMVSKQQAIFDGLSGERLLRAFQEMYGNN